MDARMLRELELDGVVRLYAPLAASDAPVEVPRVPCALFVPGLEWLVVALGEEGAAFAPPERKLLDAMLAAVGAPAAAGPEAPPDEAFSMHRPRLVLVLGEEAADLFLEPAEATELRGSVHRCRGVPAVVTFHPAELLRAPKSKAKAWEELLFARRNAPKA
jgi:hypothetical protein